MRALRFYQARELSVEKVPEPGPPGPGEVLLQPVMCGICGTDLHEYTDGPIVTPASPHPLTGAELPQILGHEFSAMVAATGTGVSHVGEGDLCTVMPLISCGHCHECVRGLGHLCRTMACTGLSSAWGGLADLAIVSAAQVIPAADTMTPRQAALIEPAAVAAYGVDRGRLQPGQTVLITGAGPIGSLAALYALAGGARRVVISEPDPSRRARAATLGEGLGEVITADPAAGPVTEVIDELTGGIGADLAVECAGHESALNLCIDAVRPAGTVVQTALHIRPASIRAETLALKDLTMVGTWCYPVQDFPRVVGLVASGRLPVERVVSSVVPLESAVTDGFERLITRGTGEVKVLIEVGSMTRLGVWYDFRNPARWRVPWPQLYRETMGQAAYAEQLGFASIWVSEHHFSEEGYLPSLSAVLGALAERTSRARLGTAVLLAPLHHPLRLAEDLAVIDQLSGGLCNVGLAPGYKPDEFAVLGVPKSQRGARTDETIEILQLAWRAEPFSYQGRHFRFDDVVVGPPPVQQPGPPIWVGGNSLAAARRAARYGARFMPDSGAGLDLYDAYRAGLAPAAGPPRVATNRVLFAAASRDEAWEICGDHFLYQFNAYRQWFSAAGDDDTHGAGLTDPAVLSPEHYFVGTPDDILAAIQASQQRLGYEELVFWARPPGLPVEQATASLELIAKHVLPALQEAAG